MDPITIEDLHIKRGKLRMTVRVMPDAHHTHGSLARHVMADFPNLPSHSCINSKGPTFADVIADTSVPHLLEHLIIDRQVAEEPPGSQATFAGHTEWVDEGAGLAAVTVNFRSDACALRAVAYACTYLNGVLGKANHDD